MGHPHQTIFFRIFFLILAEVVFLSCKPTLENDPLDVLLSRTTDSNRRAKILVFKKGGYERQVIFKHHNVEAIIKSAEAFLGTPHLMGGLSSKGIDCSGLVSLAHQQNHIALPHDGNEQARYGKIILSVDDLKRGDLVFFHSTYHTEKLVTHSGIYLGNKQFIHVSSKKGVSIAYINSKYWAEHFLFGTRL